MFWNRPSPLAYVDRFWTATDGLKLYARDYGACAGDARLPVLAIHGLTRNSADFDTIAPKIAAKGRRVLVLDVRGRGRSSRDPVPANYHPMTYAGDVISLMQGLGIGRAVFLGTSMGGLITMVLSTLRPDLIGAAILNDIGPQLAAPGLARIMDYTGKSAPVRSWKDAAAYARSINAVAFPHYTDKDWMAFARRIFGTGPDGVPTLAYDPAITAAFKDIPPGSPMPDMRPAFLALATGRPILSLRGALSDLLDPDGVDCMRTLAPHMEAVEVPRVGHAPMLDEPVAEAAVLGFLQKCP
jgi:pimeloyl-ACP methyl ester carboxylesterase